MRWLTLLLIIIPVRGLIKVRKTLPAAPGVHTKLTQTDSSQCPAACSCEPGEKDNGGMDVTHGYCHHTCSKSYNGTRYCGLPQHYGGDDAIDCSRCASPENFGASYRLYTPPSGHAKASLIFLGPWNASTGWAYHWFLEDSEQIDPLVKAQYRVLDVVGPSQDNVWHAWFGYQNWFGEEPDHHELTLAVAYVHHLIAQEYQVVGDYKKIVLAGLSQGANLALEAAIRFPQPLGLVLSERGMLTPHRRQHPFATLTTGAFLHTPFVFTVGGSDHYYTEALLKQGCKTLLGSSVVTFLKTVPGLDHYRWSWREWDVAMRSFGALLRGQALDTVTTWTSCY